MACCCRDDYKRDDVVPISVVLQDSSGKRITTMTSSSENGTVSPRNEVKTAPVVSNVSQRDAHQQTNNNLPEKHSTKPPNQNGVGEPGSVSHKQEVVISANQDTNSKTTEQEDQTRTAGKPEEEKEQKDVSSNEQKAKTVSSLQLPVVEIERVADGEGSPITLGKLFGVWTAPWPSLPEQIMRAQHFVFHPSDVILIGYAKSGTHWLWEMLHMLLRGQAEHCRTPKERLMLSFSTQEFFDTLPPPRVFNTHAPFAGLPPSLTGSGGRCKMVYLLRNPKDVAVSYYHHLKTQVDFQYEGSFHGYLDLFLEGKVPGDSWFDYVLGWEATLKDNPQLPVQVVHYEDIKEDPVAVLRQLSGFLGVSGNEELLARIADKCSFQQMKQVDQSLKDRGPQHVNVSKTSKNFIYRKGEVGDWRNWFSVADNTRFDKLLHSKLNRSSLRFRYELPQQKKEAE